MSDARQASAQDVVDLRLVEKGTELWPAIEAAQFARVVVHDDPRNDDEGRALRSFVDALSRVTEAWERTPAENRGALLNVLGEHVRALGGLGLFIHWGCVERRLAASGYGSAPVPLAIVSVDRHRFSTIAVALPDELDVSAEGLDPDA